MTQEEKQLLIKDLSARLPYGVKVDHFLDLLRIEKDDVTKELLGVIPSSENVMIGYDINNYEDSVIEDFKPYLRPMSSMTQEERDEIEEMSHGWFYVNEDGEIFPVGQLTDSGEFEDAILPTLEWLNKKMFDYRGLIPVGLALEAPEGMYKFE